MQITQPTASPSNATPQADTAAGGPGTATAYSRGDHAHPSGGTLAGLLAFTTGGNGAGAGATSFIGPAVISSVEGVVTIPIAAPGTYTRLYAHVNAAPSAGQSFTYTVRLNGVDQLITCQIAGVAVAANDTAHSVTVAAGDLLCIKIVTTASATGTVHNLTLAQ